MDELLAKLDNALDFTNAFTWEGTARYYLDHHDEKQITLNIEGNSTIEHSGDKQGIYSNVNDLVGTSTVIDNKTYTIIEAIVDKITTNDHLGDGEENIHVSGLVSIKIT